MGAMRVSLIEAHLHPHLKTPLKSTEAAGIPLIPIDGAALLESTGVALLGSNSPPKEPLQFCTNGELSASVYLATVAGSDAVVLSGGPIAADHTDGGILLHYSH